VFKNRALKNILGFKRDEVAGVSKKLQNKELHGFSSFFFFFFYPAFTTLYEFEPPHSRGSEITHKVAPKSVGLLWTSDQPVEETST
jgi:hypothetical protein